MSERTVASIEARMSSTRLPGKVLMDIGGVPALSRLITRLRRSTLLDDIVVATTVSPADDAIATWAATEGVRVHRGSDEDVLQRVVDAHHSLSSEVVVEVTGDCTLIDPNLIDMGIAAFRENECDVVTNVRKPSFPMGADVQVFRANDLAEIARTVDDPAVREHVSLYLYEHPERYRIMHLMAPPRWHGPAIRLQLDHPEDLRFIREVYARLSPTYGDAFGLEEIMRLLREDPTLTEINAHCEEKPVR